MENRFCLVKKLIKNYATRKIKANDTPTKLSKGTLVIEPRFY
jgi:hypothetical protein